MAQVVVGSYYMMAESYQMLLLTPCLDVTNLATVESLILQLAPSNILLADMNIDIARVVLLIASLKRHRAKKRTAAHII